MKLSRPRVSGNHLADTWLSLGSVSNRLLSCRVPAIVGAPSNRFSNEKLLECIKRRVELGVDKCANLSRTDSLYHRGAKNTAGGHDRCQELAFTHRVSGKSWEYMNCSSGKSPGTRGGDSMWFWMSFTAEEVYWRRCCCDDDNMSRSAGGIVDGSRSKIRRVYEILEGSQGKYQNVSISDIFSAGS
jgi:hypothetical protein